MEPRWLTLVCAVVAHALLILVLFPSYWSRLERRSGRTWADFVVPVLMPMSFATVLAAQLLGHWRDLPGLTQVLGSLGIGASTATVIIALSKLRSSGA